MYRENSLFLPCRVLVGWEDGTEKSGRRGWSFWVPKDEKSFSKDLPATSPKWYLKGRLEPWMTRKEKIVSTKNVFTSYLNPCFPPTLSPFCLLLSSLRSHFNQSIFQKEFSSLQFSVSPHPRNFKLFPPNPVLLLLVQKLNLYSKLCINDISKDVVVLFSPGVTPLSCLKRQWEIAKQSQSLIWKEVPFPTSPPHFSLLQDLHLHPVQSTRNLN